MDTILNPSTPVAPSPYDLSGPSSASTLIVDVTTVDDNSPIFRPENNNYRGYDNKYELGGHRLGLTPVAAGNVAPPPSPHYYGRRASSEESLVLEELVVIDDDDDIRAANEKRAQIFNQLNNIIDEDETEKRSISTASAQTQTTGVETELTIEQVEQRLNSLLQMYARTGPDVVGDHVLFRLNTIIGHNGQQLVGFVPVSLPGILASSVEPIVAANSAVSPVDLCRPGQVPTVLLESVTPQPTVTYNTVSLVMDKDVGLNEVPVRLVNHRQYARILKRRAERQRIAHRIVARRKFMYESRSNHALARKRGPSGRFNSISEKAAEVAEQQPVAAEKQQPSIATVEKQELMNTASSSSSTTSSSFTTTPTSSSSSTSSSTSTTAHSQ